MIKNPKKRLFLSIRKSKIYHKVRKLSLIEDFIKINNPKISKIESYIGVDYYDALSAFLIENELYNFNLSGIVNIIPGFLIKRGLEYIKVGRVLNTPIYPSSDVEGLVLVVYFEDISLEDLMVFRLGGEILDITLLITRSCIGIVSNARDKSFSRAKKEFLQIKKEIIDGSRSGKIVFG